MIKSQCGQGDEDWRHVMKNNLFNRGILPGFTPNEDIEYDLPLCDDSVPAISYNQECICHNIKINGTGSLSNGSCDSFHDGKPWCYVIGEHSTCSDKQLSSKNEKIQKILGGDFKDVYFSYQACESQDQKSADLGSFMEDIEIIGEYSQDIIGVSSPQACQHECFVRSTGCQAWTFLWIQDKTRNCLLKYSRQLCVNTFAAKLENPLAISGFSCPADKNIIDIKCWSTNGNYPGFCPHIDYRADGSGSDNTLHTSATVGIGSVKNPRQYSRLNFKFVNGRWRAVRPKNQES